MNSKPTSLYAHVGITTGINELLLMSDRIHYKASNLTSAHSRSPKSRCRCLILGQSPANIVDTYSRRVLEEYQHSQSSSGRLVGIHLQLTIGFFFNGRGGEAVSFGCVVSGVDVKNYVKLHIQSRNYTVYLDAMMFCS